MTQTGQTAERATARTAEGPAVEDLLLAAAGGWSSRAGVDEKVTAAARQPGGAPDPRLVALGVDVEELYFGGA